MLLTLTDRKNLIVRHNSVFGDGLYSRLRANPIVLKPTSIKPRKKIIVACKIKILQFLIYNIELFSCHMYSQIQS